MMIGEKSYASPRVHVPPWSFTTEDPTTDPSSFTVNPNTSVDDYSVFFQNDSLPALRRYLQNDVVGGEVAEIEDGVGDFSADVHSCDHFRMFEFKVRMCTRGRSHDWTECPFAHPGEKARRRDPRKYHYSGTACPDFRRGSCLKGDSCELAHGVFECWLHPARYRTQPCKDGMNCRRRVCFFAHSPDQLRVLSPRTESSYSGSPPPESPPTSPLTTNALSPLSRSVGSTSMNEMVASLRQLQLNKVKSMPSTWNLQPGVGLGSPRLAPGYFSLPTTPTRVVTRPGIGYFEGLENTACEEEPAMERVESGRDLRAKMFEKLSKENPLDRSNPNQTPHLDSSNMKIPSSVLLTW